MHTDHVPQQQPGGGCSMFPSRYLIEILRPGRSGLQRNFRTSGDTCHKPYQARADHQNTSAMDFHLKAKQQGDPQKYW